MTPECWKQIKRVFHAALEHEPTDRLTFLAETCADNSALQREVESLLASHEQAESFIETPASDVAAALLAEAHPGLSRGQMVGPFKISDLLATGGMGEVYLADDTRLGRKVALKLLPSEFTANVNRVLRFGQEARSASALNHPNIVTIYEIGQTDSVHFMATEFVEGETLREHMEHTSMTLDDVLDVASQVASALHSAHEAGIVHRDVKPENIMLRPDGMVKVLDFGLAKLAPDKMVTVDPNLPTNSMVKTNPGVVMGTVAYMSPEQARGQEVDARTDIWSLGVVLYEMLSGRAPFVGETTSHVIVSILESEPPPLARVGGVPLEMGQIVLKALSKERSQRYQTVGELALNLKKLKEKLDFEYGPRKLDAPYASGGKTRTKNDPLKSTSASVMDTAGSAMAALTSSAESLLTGIKRHRGTTIFASLTLCLLTASFLYFFKGRVEPLDSVAVLPFINVNGDPEVEYLSDGISDSVIDSLSSLANFKVTSLNTVLRYKGKQIDPQVVGRELRVRAVLIGRMTQHGDDMSIRTELVDVTNNSRLWAGSYTRPRSDILTVQEEIAKDIAEGLRLRLGSTERQRLAKNYTGSTDAYVAYLTGRHLVNRRTVPSIEKSIEYFQQAVKVDPNYALAYAALANAYISLSWLNARLPAEVLPEATAAVAKALEIDETLAEAHAALGNIKLVYWDWAGAEREFKRAIELNPNYQRNHSDYDQYLRTMKRYDEAVAESKRILELEPVSVIYNRNLAVSLYMARRYDEAIEQSLKTLELDPNMSTAYGWLAKSYERKRLYDQALEAYVKSSEFSVDGRDAAAALRNAYVGSSWKAVLRKMLELRQEQAQQRIVSPYVFAETYAKLGEKDQALACLEKSYEQHIPFLTFLNDPLWDDLRMDPRFADMVRKMGLQP